LRPIAGRRLLKETGPEAIICFAIVFASIMPPMLSTDRKTTTQYLLLIERLRQYFPDLTPIKRPPPLHAGRLGVKTVGRRDFESHFDTYVTTVVVSYSWIPLFALGAFRVRYAAIGAGHFISLNLSTTNDRAAIAELCPVRGKLHFVGREPLSGFAKMMDSLVVLLLAVIVALMLVR
jgi:hypothetical protein